MLVVDTGVDNCFQVSLEMSVRVLTVALHWCNPMKRHAYMRSIEKSAALLTSRGHITGVEVRPILTTPPLQVHRYSPSQRLTECFVSVPPTW